MFSVWIECLEEDVPILDQYSEAACVLSRSSSFHVTPNATAVLPPGCITTQLAGDDHCRIHMQIKVGLKKNFFLELFIFWELGILLEL